MSSVFATIIYCVLSAIFGCVSTVIFGRIRSSTTTTATTASASNRVDEAASDRLAAEKERQLRQMVDSLYHLTRRSIHKSVKHTCESMKSPIL